MENGNSFTIEAVNLSERNYYIQSATLNGVSYSKCFIGHEDIMKGGTLRFTMGPKPDTKWGSRHGDFPVSSITDQLITPVPSIDWGKGLLWTLQLSAFLVLQRTQNYFTPWTEESLI